MYTTLNMGNCIMDTKCTSDSTPEHTKDNKIFKCKVLSCYDDDTITVEARLESKFFTMKVRMCGYDSPEMKPPKSDGKRTKNAIEDKFLNKLVKMKFHGFDKYGRLLGTVYLSQGLFSCFSVEENVKECMILDIFISEALT